MNIGFSTGSISKGNFQYAIQILAASSANVIELSALRETELDVLLNSLDKLDLSHFNYISFHAPSKLLEHREDWAIDKLEKVKEMGFNIVLHPDVIVNIYKWRRLGDLLCIENMDKRKPIGRTSKDLSMLFNELPDAGFCVDLAHARQVDPSMTEATLMLKEYRSKLRQIHLSDVNSQSIHEPLNLESILFYHRVAHLIDKDIPIVLESPVTIDKIEQEIDIATIIFDENRFNAFISSLGLAVQSVSGHFYTNVS